MKFLEEIASRLDEEGLESRAVDTTLYVPISTEVEVRFVELDAPIAAASVYVAAAELPPSAGEEEPGQALVGVVFTAEDAVATVLGHVATDQVVTIVRRLLDGADDRLAELEFYQDDADATMVWADVGERSELCVLVESVAEEPTARVSFHLLGEGSETGPALELGEFHDYERLVGALALAHSFATQWERELAEFDAREDEEFLS